jgi:hypothetical protein
MTVRTRLGLGITLLAMSLAVPASAQQVSAAQSSGQVSTDQESAGGSQAGRPYRGLFGMGSPAARGGHLLDLTASIYEEYGNTQQADAAVATPLLGTGWFLGFNGGLTFRKDARYTRFVLLGDTTLRYYRTTGETTAPRFHAEMGIDSQVGHRRQNSVGFRASVDREPYFILSIFPGSTSPTEGAAIVPVNRDDLFDRQDRYIYGQGFNVEQQWSQRTFFRFSESARAAVSDSPNLDVRTVQAYAGIGHRMTRYASLVLGYGYRYGQMGAGATQRLKQQDINVGIDYQRPLTRSRRTTFGLTTGSSLVDVTPNRQWQVVGGVNLRHEFASGWFIRGDFTRNTQLVEGFADPFFVSTVQASLGGFAGRRLELNLASGYSRGTQGFTSQRYNTVQGSARVRLALARFVAVDTEALVNRQDFDRRIVMPGAVPSQLDRWSVRCNVAIWLPLSR